MAKEPRLTVNGRGLSLEWLWTFKKAENSKSQCLIHPPRHHILYEVHSTCKQKPETIHVATDETLIQA
jgi:hypothetical protein